MFVLARALTYAALFIGILLIFVPARLLSGSGLSRPTGIGVPEIGGAIVVGVGAALAVACVLALAIVGRGTPAPFDPPRRLVVCGPYRLMRNPMYAAATLALAGAALFFQSRLLFVYAGLFILACHLLVVGYEEPTLRRNFGAEYAEYCSRVRRWWPIRRFDARDQPTG